MSEGWARIKPAARHSGVSERTLRGWLKKGLRHARLPSGTVLVKLSDLDAFLARFVREADEVDRIADAVFKEFK